MAITVSWDDEQQTVVRMQFSESWSLKEFRAANLQTVLLVRSVDHRVYVLSDARASTDIPIGILWQLRDMISMRPKNWSGGIVITQNSIVKGVVDILGYIYMRQHSQRLFIVTSQVEADAIIARLKAQDQGL